jgi:hypothetical protein
MKPLTVEHVNFRENETFLKNFSDGPKRDKGQLFFQIDLPDNPGAEDALAEKLWRSLHDSFFNCQSDDAYFCFEEALKATNEALEQENKKRESGTIGRIHAVASLLQEGMLHFSQAGKAVVALRRGDYFGVISEGAEPESESEFSTISSGDLSNGDSIAFMTRPLPFGDTELLTIFSEKVSKVAGQIRGLSKQKEITGMVSFFVFQDENIEPVTPIEEIIDEKIEQSQAMYNAGQEKGTETSDEMAQSTTDIPVREKKKGKAAQILSSFGKKFSGERAGKAGKAVKGIFSGMGSKMSKIVKKPDSIKQINRRYLLIAVIGLVAILGVLLTLQSNYREQTQQAQYFESLLSQVKMNIETAEQRHLIGDKADSTKFLNKATTGLEEIEAAGFYQSDVVKIKNEIELQRDVFDSVFRVKNPNVFADLSQKGTVDALGLVNTADQRNFVYEPRRLFETLLDKVQEPLQIDQEEIVTAGAELEDFNVLAFTTQSGQVMEYEVRNGRFAAATTQDDTWNKGVDIKTFNGEFIYLLDTGSNTIWKYRRLRSGYSTASAYNSEGDLSNAVSLAIDGDIYALNRDGSIVRFRKGKVLPYEIKSQPSLPLENPTRIFTLPEASKVYVLDSVNSRVVVYTKDDIGSAQYDKQVVFETLKPNEIRDFYVDKDEQKLTVLTADKVYISDL